MGSTKIHSESEDRRVLETLIKGMSAPPGVLSYDIKVHDDSTGDASIFILFKINEKFIAGSTKRFNALWLFADQVQKEALRNGVSRWPYVELISGVSRRR